MRTYRRRHASLWRLPLATVLAAEARIGCVASDPRTRPYSSVFLDLGRRPRAGRVFPSVDTRTKCSGRAATASAEVSDGVSYRRNRSSCSLTPSIPHIRGEGTEVFP